jgi:hypothetical protein
VSDSVALALPWAPHLAWVLGGEARFVVVRADAVTLESTTPSPPGSRIDGVLVSGSLRTVRVKVHLSRREASGRFRIEGRPIDLTREAREELEAMVRV